MLRTMRHKKSTASKLRYAARLRERPQRAEVKVYDYLLNKYHFNGWPKHQEQVILRGYIVDCLFRSCNVILEIDGYVHRNPTKKEKDAERQSHLESAGYTVLRVTNEDVYANVAKALEPLEKLLESIGAINKDYRPISVDQSLPVPKVYKPTFESRSYRTQYKRPRKKLTGDKFRKLCKQCGNPYYGDNLSDYCTAECTASAYGS